MLGMILMMAWTGFVACYLLWQQLSGDLADGTVSGQPSAVSYPTPASVTEWGLMADR